MLGVSQLLGSTLPSRLLVTFITGPPAASAGERRKRFLPTEQSTTSARTIKN